MLRWANTSRRDQSSQAAPAVDREFPQTNERFLTGHPCLAFLHTLQEF